MKHFYKLILTLITGLTSLYSFANCTVGFQYTGDSTGYTFTFNPSPGHVSYSWNFGDGTTDTSANPTHTYSRAGQFLVCVTAVDSLNCISKYCDSLEVISKCATNFTYTINENVATFSVTGGAKSNTTYTWRIADSVTKTGATVTHTYPQSNRVYNVCLTATDTVTNCSYDVCKTIRINWASCDASYTKFQSKKKFTFTMKNYRPGITWRWTVNDTVKNNSDTIFVYNGSYNRSYRVCLYVEDSSKNCQDSFCTYVWAYKDSCMSTFTYNQNGNSFTFYPTDSIQNLFWTFGDGTSSRDMIPTKAYSKAGSYTVCLTAICNQTDTSITCTTVSVKPKCKAEFKVAIDTSKKYRLYLINKSTKAVGQQYLWDFGDGNKSNQRNPSHGYTSFGLFNVCLTITDSAGSCTSTYCDSIGLDSNGQLLKADGWELMVLDESVFGVEDQEVKKLFHYYPNPTTGKIFIRAQESTGEKWNCGLYSLTGEKVKAFNIQEIHSSFEIDLDVPTGFYFLRMESDSKSWTSDVIRVQR